MDSKNNHLLVIVGPTAVGKTSVAIEVAKFLNTEIISADSRQFFREMDLGTAKPSLEELESIPHHLINNLSIHDSYDVRDFEKDALGIMGNLFVKNQTLILTGGSGLYVDAVCHGFDPIPDIPPSIRGQIIHEYQSLGLPFLQEEVQKLDPEYFEQVDQKNPQRLMRALEVCRGTGRPFSSFRKKKKVNRPFQIIKIGLERPREELYKRIDTRMDQMVSLGLFEEAKELYSYRHLNALQTVGYTEIFDFLEGKYDREEAVRLLKRNSRRYAKRQMTWFKKDQDITWFHPDELDGIMDYIRSRIPLG